MGTERAETLSENEFFHLRKVIVSRLLTLKKKSEGLTRSAQLLSVSIVDKFFSCNNKLKQNFNIPLSETNIYAAASLFLACKFDGIPHEIF